MDRIRLCRRRDRSSGQTLVEFALVFPIFLLLTFALIEFAFVFSATLGISYATRDAALLGAEAGDAKGADCVILQKVEQDVTAPASDARIDTVTIYKAGSDGKQDSLNPNAYNTWKRGTSTLCPDNVTTVPYVQQTFGYPETDRCNVLKGCPDDTTRPLDIIGVRVVYQHQWVTPLGGFGGNGFGGQGGSGFTLTQSNSMRMEPIL